MPMPRSRPSFRALQCLNGASPSIITRTARCVLYYNTSCQGVPLRAPVGSPRPAALHRPDHFIEGRFQRQRNVWPLHRHSGGASRLPQDPHGQRVAVGSRPGSCRLDRTGGDFALPWTPSSRVETSALPLHPHRSACAKAAADKPKSLRALWKPGQPSSIWIRASVSPLDHDPTSPSGFVGQAGVSAPASRRFAIHTRIMYYFNRIRFCESTII